ncbi:MAG: metallophosphoesterase [Bacteroidales bacterium]|nr:metallophosphoesterase [Bacteroidales bacterium]
MDRRSFIKTGAVATVAAGMGIGLDAKERPSRKSKKEFTSGVTRNVQPYGDLKIKEITIDAGARKPFRVLHVSDSHLSCADARDDARKITLAASRSAGWPDAQRNWLEATRFARDNNLLLVHTGDLSDFVSEANLDIAAKSFLITDSFCSCGNHEFSRYVGEAKEDLAYKMENFDKVQAAFPNGLKVSSRIVNGVNLVAMDDVYYNVTEEEHDLVRKEFEKGLPVILLCHVPFYTPDLCAYSLERMKGYCAYVTGAPLEITSTFQNDPSLPEDLQWKNRAVQQKADRETLAFISWLKGQTLLKGILCGHLHYYYEGPFSPAANQYVCGAGYNGEVQLVTIK